jgi:hypothetical protein
VLLDSNCASFDSKNRAQEFVMLPGLTGIDGAKSFEEFSVEVMCHTDLAEETNVIPNRLKKH